MSSHDNSVHEHGGSGCCHSEGGKVPVGGSSPGHAAKDPVCGMDVDPHTAKHRADHEGRPYYFCCAGCRTKFVNDPQRYLKADQTKESVPVGTYLHVPDASGDPSGRARFMSDLRHGART